MRARDEADPNDATRRYSPTRAALFDAIFARYFRRHMNALRVDDLRRAEALNAAPGPLILYTNHPGWWDGMLYVLLARRCFPGRRPFAPIAAEMLAKYGFFARIGGFAVELDTARGAAAFLRQSEHILRRPDSLLWISAQGHFSDPRTRPVQLRTGIVRLPEIAPHARIAPTAFEYPFWNERGAEALVRFGEGWTGEELAAVDRKARLSLLEGRLTETLDNLADSAIRRDPSAFDTVLQGRSGVGGVFDAWKRVLARARGERWSPSHEGPL